MNEMVSLGDTAIILHILQLFHILHFVLPKFQFSGAGVFCSSQNSKCQDLPKFHFSGGGGGSGGRCCSVPNPRTGYSGQFEHKFCLATFWNVEFLHHWVFALE